MRLVLSRALSFSAAFAWAFLLSPLTGPALAEPTNDNPWVALAPIPEVAGLEGHCTSLIANKIYTAFGFTQPSDTNSLRIYDIGTNTWVFGASAPTAGRSEHYRGVAKAGRLYCLGGRTTNETWSFDTVASTWSQKAAFPDTSHVGTTAATFGNSIFVFGGRSGRSPCSTGASAAVRRYDVDQDVWSPAGNMAVARSDATVARVGGFIYIFGGCNGPTTFFQSTEKYDPRTGTSVVINTTMPGGARADAAAGDPQNGGSANAAHRIHVTGGFNDSGVLPVAQNHLMYDVDENTFLVGVPMPTHCAPGVNRAEHELVHGKDKVIALGGACPRGGSSLPQVDMQRLSDPPVPSASITAYSCNDHTFPACVVQPLGASGAFIVGSGFALLSTVQISSSLQGPLPPIVTDVQGELTDAYVDTFCNGQPRTITAVDALGNSASTTFNCP